MIAERGHEVHLFGLKWEGEKNNEDVRKLWV